MSRLTGGQVYKYTYFQSDLDGERFISDLAHNVSRPVVFDAIMRVRTSTGVRPTDFFGSFYMANTTDMELASLNSDMSLACEIKHDDKLTDEDGVYIQAALLFTSVSGKRRLRICNLSLNTCDNMGELYRYWIVSYHSDQDYYEFNLFRHCDLDTMVNFLAKQNISKLMESSPKAVKEGLMSQCATILACYRKNCASPSSAGQLILPECMKVKLSLSSSLSAHVSPSSSSLSTQTVSSSLTPSLVDLTSAATTELTTCPVSAVWTSPPVWFTSIRSSWPSTTSTPRRPASPSRSGAPWRS